EQVENLRINKSVGRIRGKVSAISYRDKDTRQIVIYLPSLELSGYGETEKKAREILKFSMEEYFNFLLDMPLEKINSELSKLGWKHNRIKNKEFSKSHV